MRMSLPRPLHGWRAFSGEVGVIVLGVLIALAAQQVVEAIGWRQQVHEARDALGFELADAIGQANVRQELSPCIQRRLGDVSVIIDRASQSGRLPPVGAIGWPPYYTWVTATWETTQAGQTASHFDRRELNGLARIYEYVNALKGVAPRELAVWSRLYSVVGPGRPIAPAEVSSLRQDIVDARLLDQLVTVSSIRVRQIADAEELKYDHDFVQRRSVPLASRSLCRPIPARAPETYGHAPMQDGMQQALENPLRGPN
jgi:hypothetical protein